MENEKEPPANSPAEAGETTKASPSGPGAAVREGGEEPTPPAEPELPADLPAAYRTLRRERDQLYDRLLRKQAELENFRKRLQREKEEFLQHATADLIRALLPTLDGFERALGHRESSVPEEFLKGMELIYHHLLEVLGRAGLSPIETAGRLFDPHLHQAVETVEAPGYRDHEIVEELQRGYNLRNRLLRPAIVKVALRPHGDRVDGESGLAEPDSQTAKGRGTSKPN